MSRVAPWVCSVSRAGGRLGVRGHCPSYCSSGDIRRRSSVRLRQLAGACATRSGSQIRGDLLMHARTRQPLAQDLRTICSTNPACGRGKDERILRSFPGSGENNKILGKKSWLVRHDRVLQIDRCAQTGGRFCARRTQVFAALRSWRPARRKDLLECARRGR